jgi:hypothetical protein
VNPVANHKSPAPDAQARHLEESDGPRSAKPAPLLITALLVPVMGLGLHRLAVTQHLPDSTPAPQAPAAVGPLIDPNTAPWWEMTVIPGVGEVTARRIVEFREACRRAGSQDGGSPHSAVEVFRCPADLQQVKGLGPKTVQRIAPYLTFSQPDTSRDDP